MTETAVATLEGLVRLCRADQIPFDRPLKVELPGQRALAVYRVDGQIYVTDDSCTHATASLSEGEIDGDVIVCPVHFGEFHIPTGKARGFPACVDLRTYRVAVIDGCVLIDTAHTAVAAEEDA
jgi:ethylbenzene dioxygenase ferredoxin subunit